MKRNRFSEEQIIGILKEHEAGVPQARRQRCQHLQMESEVRRHGRLRGQTAEGAGRGEDAAETAAGRCHARQCGAEGFIGKEVVMPAAERRAVAHLKEVFEITAACEMSF